MKVNITMYEATVLFRAARSGWSPIGETVAEAIANIGGDVLLTPAFEDEVAVVFLDGELIGVGGDSWGRNPWAVKLVYPRSIRHWQECAASVGNDVQVGYCARALEGNRESLLMVASLMAESIVRCEP